MKIISTVVTGHITASWVERSGAGLIPRMEREKPVVCIIQAGCRNSLEVMCMSLLSLGGLPSLSSLRPLKMQWIPYQYPPSSNPIISETMES